MKKFTKLFLSCAAVAALTAALATSAMAADTLRGDIEGSYENGTLTLTAPTGAADTKTLLVLEGTDRTNIQATAVRAIDQNATIATVKLPTTGDNAIDTAEKTYTVLMGGGDKIFVAEFGKVSGVPMIVGNVDGDDIISADDATCILWKAALSSDVNKVVNAGKTINLASGGTTLCGDVDGDGSITADDATCVLWKAALSSDTNKIVNAGSEITGTMAE